MIDLNGYVNGILGSIKLCFFLRSIVRIIIKYTDRRRQLCLYYTGRHITSIGYKRHVPAIGYRGKNISIRKKTSKSIQ